MTDLVLLRRHGDHIAEITLNRPQSMNALSTALSRELIATCATLATDPAIRAIVLSGAPGRAFCAGADLKERNGMSDAEILAQRPVVRAVFGAVRGLPQPTIAAVGGFALGGGFELALNCDLIVADDTAVLGLPEVTVGLVPGGGGTQLTLRRLGAGLAADLVLTGRRVAIDEAERRGLIDRRAPAGEAVKVALDLAATIAGNSPVSVRAAKRALRAGDGLPMEAALDIEENAWRTAAVSQDRREGIAAFAEKRSPSFRSM